MSSLRKKSAIEIGIEKGDESGLEKLFTSQQERLWRMVDFRMDRRLVGRIDPEDILQEGYIAARQRMHHFKDTQMSPFVWLRTILAQTLTDVTRRHLSAQMRSVEREFSMNQQEEGQTTSLCIADHLAGSDTSPSQVAARNETVRRIEKAIAQMDSIDQEILALRHFEDLTNLEVSETLGIQQKAASIRYMRALKRLKEILATTQGYSEELRGNSG